jgi:hypothetical protein
MKNNLTEIVFRAKKIVNELATQQPAQQQPVAQQPAQQEPKTITAQRLSRSYSKTPAVQTASKQINTATKFPDAFKTWFQTLGYKPENPAISIMKVKTEVEKAMRDMGYK